MCFMFLMEVTFGINWVSSGVIQGDLVVHFICLVLIGAFLSANSENVLHQVFTVSFM